MAERFPSLPIVFEDGELDVILVGDRTDFARQLGKTDLECARQPTMSRNDYPPQLSCDDDQRHEHAVILHALDQILNFVIRLAINGKAQRVWIDIEGRDSGDGSILIDSIEHDVRFPSVDKSIPKWCS